MKTFELFYETNRELMQILSNKIIDTLLLLCKEVMPTGKFNVQNQTISITFDKLRYTIVDVKAIWSEITVELHNFDWRQRAGNRRSHKLIDVCHKFLNQFNGNVHYSPEWIDYRFRDGSIDKLFKYFMEDSEVTTSVF